MVPQIFLSLSGHDEKFAKQVADALPHGLARIYQDTFENGENLLRAMEKGVGASTIIVLLASKESLASHWVNFELDLARLGAVQGQNRVLAFAIEEGISAGDYPAWMREQWIASHVYNPKDIARIVSNILFSEEYLGLGQFNDVIGRGELLDQARRSYLSIAADTKETPNILFFSGTTQIGRRTFARLAIQNLFPSKPDLVKGPHLDLPQFADLADIYRGLLNNVQFEASQQQIEANLLAFGELSLDDQLEEIVALLAYFADRNMAVFAYTGSGLFDETGTTKVWLWPLVDRLASTRNVLLVFITNRRLRENDVIEHPNALQVFVPALKDEDTAALTTALASAYDLEPFQFSAQLTRAIGGHPGVTKSAVRLVANQGLALVERQPNSVFSAQTFILSHNIDEANLSAAQLRILFALSWLPSLRADLLESTVVCQGVTQDDFISAIEELLLSCLIVTSDEDFAISKELRAIFRRRYGFGDEGLLDRLGEVLAQEFKEAEAEGRFDAKLVDAIVFMHALAGKGIPDELRKVVLPSKFAEIMRTRYNQGRDDRDVLNQIVSWGHAVLEMKLDDTVREEVLGILVQSLVRLRTYDQADAFLTDMETKGYRSAAFLRGFRLRREGKIEEAIPILREAIRIRKNIRYSVQELATIFHSLGREQDLSELLKEHQDVVKDSAVLLDFEIGRLISGNDFTKANELIAELEDIPADDGRSVIRRAQIESQRWGNHQAAFEMVNELVQGGVGDQVRTRRWRALFGILADQKAFSQRDIEFLRSKYGQEGTVERLDVYQAIQEGNGPRAEELSKKLDLQAKQNRSLRARALEILLKAPIGAAEKARIKDEIESLGIADNLSIIEI